MKKYKKNIALFLAFVFIVVMIAGCAAEKEETTEETISQTMPETIEEQIKPGQTYSEVCEIIGFDGTDVGYGAILYEWKIEGGDSLLVWFVKPNTEDAVFPDDLIVQNCRTEKQ